MNSNNLSGTEGQSFKLILGDGYYNKYVMGCDPYEQESESYSVSVISKPKQEFGIKKIKGFKRVISKGWSYVCELIK